MHIAITVADVALPYPWISSYVMESSLGGGTTLELMVHVRGGATQRGSILFDAAAGRLELLDGEDGDLESLAAAIDGRRHTVVPRIFIDGAEVTAPFDEELAACTWALKVARAEARADLDPFGRDITRTGLDSFIVTGTNQYGAGVQ